MEPRPDLHRGSVLRTALRLRLGGLELGLVGFDLDAVLAGVEELDVVGDDVVALPLLAVLGLPLVVGDAAGDETRRPFSRWLSQASASLFQASTSMKTGVASRLKPGTASRIRQTLLPVGVVSALGSAVRRPISWTVFMLVSFRDGWTCAERAAARRSRSTVQGAKGVPPPVGRPAGAHPDQGCGGATVRRRRAAGKVIEDIKADWHERRDQRLGHRPRSTRRPRGQARTGARLRLCVQACCARVRGRSGVSSRGRSRSRSTARPGGGGPRWGRREYWCSTRVEPRPV